MTKLSIIILNFNTPDLVINLINSISTKLSHEIIVVDNASTDNSVTQIQTQLPQINLVQSPSNVGFAAGNNLGLKIAKGKYIITLNSDTIVVKDALDTLASYLDRHPRVGIITPKLTLSDGAIDLSCHRGFPTLTNSLSYFMGLQSLFPNSRLTSGYHQTWKDFNTTHQVDAVSGAAMMFRKDLLSQIGYLDEQFFMYAEDIDFCLRAKQHGWQVVYHPPAQVIHLKGGSGTHSPDTHLQSSTRRHFYSTMKQYFAKHHSSPPLVRSLVNLGIDLVSKVRQ